MAEKNSLWRNIRNKAAQNRRTGAKPKKPTREMIRQERKIKAKKAEGGPIGENDIPYRPLGIPMENYEPELLDNYNSTISLKRTGSNNINLRLPEYHNQKDKKLNFHPYFNASTPEPNVNVYYGGVETDLNLLNKNQNKINLKGGLGTGVVLTPGSSEYIGVQPSVGLSFTRDFAEGGYYPTQGPPKALFKGYAQGGYTNPYNQYQDDPYLNYAVGGKVWKNIAAGAYGLGEGILDTVTGGATDQLTDKGFEALTKAGNKNIDLNNPDDVKYLKTQQKIKGYGNTAAAVGTGIVTGNVQGAIQQGTKGLNTAFQATDGLSDDFKKVSQGITSVAGIASGFAGGLNSESFKSAQKAGTGVAGFAKKAGKIAPFANQALGMIGGGQQPLWQQGQQAQDYLKSPEYLALQRQGNISVNQGITFSQGGNITNNSLNLRNTMRYKRFAQGGTLEQQGINFITDKAGLHYQNANGGVPIGPDALAEGGEAKLQMADGGQYIVSGEVDGANTQSINGETMTQRLKKKLKPFMMGGLASNPKDKDNLRRPFDSYSAESIAQVKNNSIQETEAIRMQRGGALQYAANGGKLTKDIEKIVMEEYAAAYGGMLPNKYKGKVNMPNSYAKGGIHIKESKKGTFTAAATKHGKGVQEFAKQVLANKEDYSSATVKKANFAHNAAGWKHADGGYVHNQMTQPMYAEGGSTWIPSDQELLNMGYSLEQIQAIKLADNQSPVFESEDEYNAIAQKADLAKRRNDPRGESLYSGLRQKTLDESLRQGTSMQGSASFNDGNPIDSTKMLNQMLADEEARPTQTFDTKWKSRNQRKNRAVGGPLYGDPASPYTYAYGGMYGDPYYRGGQIDYTNDMYSSYAGGGPMVGNAPQVFTGYAAQNRGGMLMNYADGGMMPQEQQMMQQAPQEQMQQQGGQDQMMQMVQQVIEALMQGAPPEQIMQQLVQSGIPQDQAQQIIQAAMQQAQGQQQQQPMQGEQPMQQEQQQMPPQQGMSTGGRLPKDVLRARVSAHMSPKEADNYVNNYSKGGKMYYTGGVDGPPYRTATMPMEAAGWQNHSMYGKYEYPLTRKQEERINQIKNNMYQSLTPNNPGVSMYDNNLIGFDENGEPMYKYQAPKIPAPSMLNSYGDINIPMNNPASDNNSFLYRQDGIPMEGASIQNNVQPNNQKTSSPLSNVRPGITFTNPELDYVQPYEQPAAVQTPLKNVGISNLYSPQPPAPYIEGISGVSNTPLTEAEAIANGYKPTQGAANIGTTIAPPVGGSEDMSGLDYATMASQLAGPVSQFFQKKPKPFKYQKPQYKELNPTEAIVASNQAQREAQATADYNIKQNAPTSGSYLANIRGTALQSAKQRGAAAAGIRSEYDKVNSAAYNRNQEVGADIENKNIDAIQQDLANYQEQKTNALYNAGANVAGMRKDYNQNQINQTIANNIGTSNWKYDQATNTIVYRTPTGQTVSVPVQTAAATNTQLTTPAAATNTQPPAATPEVPYTGIAANYLNSNKVPDFNSPNAGDTKNDKYNITGSGIGSGDYNFTTTNEYVQPLDKTDKETIKAFQDWLDDNHPYWPNSAKPLKQSKGYGTFGKQTQEAWNQYGKEFLGRVPDSYTGVNEWTPLDALNYGI